MVKPALPSAAATPSVAPVSPPPAKPSRLGNLLKAATQGPGTLFSPYPDLALAITMLEKRRGQLTAATAADQRELIDKWLVSLNKVQTEITRLRQLESLSSTLGRKPVM